MTDLMRQLDQREAEALVLAIQLRAPLLIDEEAGRPAARQHGIAITGTLAATPPERV